MFIPRKARPFVREALKWEKHTLHVTHEHTQDVTQEHTRHSVAARVACVACVKIWLLSAGTFGTVDAPSPAFSLSCSLPVLGRESLVVVLPDRVLCLPTFSHLLIINESSLLLLLLLHALSHAFSFSPCDRALLPQSKRAVDIAPSASKLAETSEAPCCTAPAQYVCVCVCVCVCARARACVWIYICT